MEPVTHHVRSIAEVRAIVRDAEPSVEQEFYVLEDTPLIEARRIWKVVRDSDEGGEGFVANPEVLGGKDGAYRFVNQKLDELKRLATSANIKLAPLNESAVRLQQVLDDGGPGLLAYFEPQAFQVPRPCISTEEEVAEEILEHHIQQLRDLILSVDSPCSPALGGYRSAQAINERERLEQEALTELNCAINGLKRNLVTNLLNDLEQGIAQLEYRFLLQPTHLGCGSGDFVRYESLPMFPADRKGHTY